MNPWLQESDVSIFEAIAPDLLLQLIENEVLHPTNWPI
jgi:hypothetical protein